MSSTTSMDPQTVSSITGGEKTRFLLTLWALSYDDGEIAKSELTSKVKQKQKGKKMGVPKTIYEELQAVDAIKVYRKNRKEMVSLTDSGKQMLIDCLTDPSFEFMGTVVATRLARGLVKLITQLNQGTITTTTAKITQISSYEEFKPVILEIFNQLNQDYNLNNLVPIYRLRRAMGDRVSRSQFREWMLEMQAHDLVQLIGGEITNGTPDQVEDSIQTDLGAIRYYIKLL